VRIRRDYPSSDDPHRRLLDHRRVPAVVRTWLLLIAASFVAGCLTIVLVPSHQSRVVNIGVGVNVAMAFGIGAVLAWNGMHRRLFCAAGLGAIVTVVGWDLLSSVQAKVQGQGWGLGAIPFDVFALPVAAIGMLILLGVGAAIGGIGRLLFSRCPCRIWPRRLRASIW
jgi:hypothetical protein